MPRQMHRRPTKPTTGPQRTITAEECVSLVQGVGEALTGEIKALQLSVADLRRRVTEMEAAPPQTPPLIRHTAGRQI